MGEPRNCSALAYSGVSKRPIVAVASTDEGQTRLTNNPARDDSPRWSPDGGKIVFVSDRDGLLEIYTMNADGSNQQRLTTNSVPDEDPAWSPDSSKLVYHTNFGDIFIVDADGTNPTLLVDHAVSGFSSLPDWTGSD